MKKIVATLLIGSLTTTQLKAECDKPVTPLKTGEQAPCLGYLFSPEKELEVRVKNEEFKLLMEQTKLYIQQTELYKSELKISNEIADREREKAEIWRKAAEQSSMNVLNMQESRQTRDLLFILAGVGLTVAAGYAVGQVSK